MKLSEYEKEMKRQLFVEPMWGVSSKDSENIQWGSIYNAFMRKMVDNMGRCNVERKPIE